MWLGRHDPFYLGFHPYDVGIKIFSATSSPAIEGAVVCRCTAPESWQRCIYAYVSY